MASPHNRTVTKTASKIASTLNSLDSEVQYKTEKNSHHKKSIALNNCIFIKHLKHWLCMSSFHFKKTLNALNMKIQIHKIHKLGVKTLFALVIIPTLAKGLISKLQ